MNVKELKEIIKDLPDDMLVITPANVSKLYDPMDEKNGDTMELVSTAVFNTPDVAGVVVDPDGTKCLMFDQLSEYEANKYADIEVVFDDMFDVDECLYPTKRKCIRTLREYRDYNMLYRLNANSSLVLVDYDLKGSDGKPLVLSNNLTGIEPWLDCKVEFIEAYAENAYTITLNTRAMRYGHEEQDAIFVKIMEESYDMKEISKQFTLATGYNPTKVNLQEYTSRKQVELVEE